LELHGREHQHFWNEQTMNWIDRSDSSHGSKE